MRHWILIVVVAMLLPGCASYVAGIDCDAALKVGTAANTANLKLLAESRIREHDKGLAQVEAIFETQLAKVTTGAQAIQELTRYRAAKVKAESAKVDATEKLQRTLNTAFWLESLVDQRIGLNAQWKALRGNIPGLANIETLAEAKVRSYMAALNKGASQ